MENLDIFMLIGLIAGVCTTIAYVPQAIKVIKTKHTKDISLATYLMLTIGVFLWLVYGISVKDLPVAIANSITFIFASIILILKIKYK